MIRASWKGALLAAAASAGVSWGGPPTAPAGTAPQFGSLVSIREKGGLPEECRVLRTWTTDKGQHAYLLQTLGSDELLTVVQTVGSGPGAAPVGVQIYRWGNSIVPPPGSPEPPSEADSGVRQASHTVAAPEPAPMPVPAAVTVGPPVPVPAPAEPPPAVGCPSGACEKDKAPPGGYVHHYETPPPLRFVPGKSVPVASPDHLHGYGYYQTQWRSWTASAAAVPPTGSEESSAPHGQPPKAWPAP